MKYISRGDWFDKGTEAKLLIDLRPKMDVGVFEGIKDGKEDEETCPFDEFDIIEETDQ